MPEIDFKAIKECVTVEKAARFLGLAIKPYKEMFRCACPICERAGDRAIAITPAIGRWYCHGGCKKGGDAIYLVAHVKGIKQTEAAKLLEEQFMRESEKPKRKVKIRKAPVSTSRSKLKQEPVGGTEDYTIAHYLGFET